MKMLDHNDKALANVMMALIRIFMNLKFKTAENLLKFKNERLEGSGARGIGQAFLFGVARALRFVCLRLQICSRWYFHLVFIFCYISPNLKIRVKIPTLKNKSWGSSGTSSVPREWSSGCPGNERPA